MQRLVKVDGKIRTDSTFPAGFMGMFWKWCNFLKIVCFFYIFVVQVPWLEGSKRQGMVWNGTEISVWNMEDNLPYFHTNSILDFVDCIYRKMHTNVQW